MSNGQNEEAILKKTEQALNAFLRDDLKYIDDLQWPDDRERLARKMAKRLNDGLSEDGVKDFSVQIELGPARIKMVTVQ